MLFILLGEDLFSMRQALEDIKRGLGDPALLEANTVHLEGQKLTPAELMTVCETTPFLSGKRLVIITGLLERFSTGNRAGRLKKNRTMSRQQDEAKAFAEPITRLPESTVLVLLDAAIRNSNPLLTEIVPGATVRSFPLLKEAKLKQWIRGRVAAEGGSISPRAVDSLASLVGGDLFMMAHEVDKLVSYAAWRRIEEEHVGLVASHSQEANVFAMVDAILEFRTKAAEQLLHQLLQRGAAPAYLMVMLSRQIHRVTRAKEMSKRGRSEGEVQKQLGLVSEFTLRRTLEQAARYSTERLREIYHRLLETDLSIKTGKLDGELALTVLVAELCRR